MSFSPQKPDALHSTRQWSVSRNMFLMCRPKHWQIHKELLPNSAALQNFLDFLRSLNCFTTLPFCSHQLCSQQQQKVVFTQKERPETWLQMMLLCPCWICLLTCVVKFFCPQVAQIAAFKKKCWNSLSFTKKGKFNHYLVTHMLLESHHHHHHHHDHYQKQPLFRERNVLQ